MFKNNLNPPPKSPSQIFKPNATMITMTADDATMKVGFKIFPLKTHFRGF